MFLLQISTQLSSEIACCCGRATTPAWVCDCISDIYHQVSSTDPQSRHRLTDSKQTWGVSHRMWWNLNRISNVLKTHIEVFELPQPKVITDLWVSYHKIGCHTCLRTGQSQKEEVEQLHSQLSWFLSSGVARCIGLFYPGDLPWPWHWQGAVSLAKRS